MDKTDKTLIFILGLLAGGILVALLIKPVAAFAAPSNLKARTYVNTEEWEIVRDPKTGRTQGVKVKRKAEES